MGWLSQKRRQQLAAPPITPVTPFHEQDPPAWLVDGVGADLHDGPARLAVVGESNYQDALWAIVGQTDQRVSVDGAVAILVPEIGNPYDDHAVSVWITGNKVGYLSRDDARQLRPHLVVAVERTGRAVAMSAFIAGGGIRAHSRLGALGVWLSYDPNDLRP